MAATAQHSTLRELDHRRGDGIDVSQQGVCGVMLAAVAVLANRASLRSAFSDG